MEKSITRDRKEIKETDQLRESDIDHVQSTMALEGMPVPRKMAEDAVDRATGLPGK